MESRDRKYDRIYPKLEVHGAEGRDLEKTGRLLSVQTRTAEPLPAGFADRLKKLVRSFFRSPTEPPIQ